MANTRNVNETIPATGSIRVVPSNTELATAIRMLTIGTAGTVSWVGVDGKTNVTDELPVGSYPMAAIRILPATTATKLTGWF